MTDLAAELSESLSSIESIKIYLAGLVGAASDSRRGEPVRLTYVGGEFAKNVGVPFEKHVTALADCERIAVPKARRKLTPFVQSYCEDIFTVTESPPGVYFVAPVTPKEGGADRSMAARAPSTLRFHRAIWAAFIQPLDGKRRFLNLDRIGFTDASEAPREGTGARSKIALSSALHRGPRSTAPSSSLVLRNGPRKPEFRSRSL
jgi:hypothetical protein